MADVSFNIGLGRTVEFAMNVNADTPTNSALVIVLLKEVEANSALLQHNTLAAVLAAAGNTESDATNYARKVLTEADGITINRNTTTNTVSVDIPNQVYTSLGGATNNTLNKALICYDPDTTAGTDADIVPMVGFDPIDPNTTNPAVTNGNNFTLNINASGLLTVQAQ